jgi:hypothetical protein
VSPSAKLYLVTRADLRHGSQAAQLVHGMATFARHYPATFEDWERTSNTVVCLTVPDEATLHEIRSQAHEASERTESGLAIAEFFEPDFDNQLTCVVLEPIEVFQDICKGLPLACR